MAERTVCIGLVTAFEPQCKGCRRMFYALRLHDTSRFVRVILAWVQHCYMIDTPPQSHVEMRGDFANHQTRACRDRVDVSEVFQDKQLFHT